METIYISWYTRTYMQQKQTYNVFQTWGKCIHGTCAAHANCIQVEFIGCSSSSNMEPWHTAWAISPNTAQIDIQYL